MKRWLIHFIIISLAILLYFSHQDILSYTSNFIIDGLIPGTHIVIDTFWTYILTASCFYGIYKLFQSLSFDMIKRDAILYNQEKQTIDFSNDNKKFQTSQLDAEDLELAQRSL